MRYRRIACATFSVERYFLPGIASVLEEAEGKEQQELIKSFKRSWLVKGPLALRLSDSNGEVLYQRGPDRHLDALSSPDRNVTGYGGMSSRTAETRILLSRCRWIAVAIVARE